MTTPDYQYSGGHLRAPSAAPSHSGAPPHNLYGQPVYPPVAHYEPQPLWSSGHNADQRPPGSAAVGLVGFVIVALTTIGFFLCCWFMQVHWVEAYNEASRQPGFNPDTFSETARYDQMIGEITGLAGGLLACTVVGFGGWITCIVGVATNRGRGWALTGLLLGILAPFLGLGAAAMGMGEAMS